MMSTIKQPDFESPVCPIPLNHPEKIMVGHGSGGRMTQDLIKKIFNKHFSNPYLNAGNDFAKIIPDEHFVNGGHLSISTDAHIVSPLFFPGGDIGRLSICGTVNDVSMSGAIPLYLTASFILEEGLEIDLLEKVVISMQETADEAEIKIVAGDTKVVEKGKADGIFISTSGFGWVKPGLSIGGECAQPGDAVLVSGTLGDHGVSVLSARSELGFETDVVSDVAPLNHLIQGLISEIPNIHVLRDPTRGGLATTLNEIAFQSNVGISIEENLIPIKQSVRSVCELLGFDPLYVANEGKVIIILPFHEVDHALEILGDSKYGKAAAYIGKITAENPKRVLLKTIIGGTRVLDTLAGEMLPRIC